MILNDLTPEKFLSKDEERKIIALCKQDNLIAKRRLILSNIRYIYAQAQKLCKNQNQIGELVMEGIIGLLKAIPKFETAFDAEMSAVLKTMGMTDAFDSSLADFSKMATHTDGNIYISRVLHKTFISVAEQGT